MSYNKAFNTSHEPKKVPYCETIDPDDNHGQDQDCIDYDPDPLGGGGSNLYDHEQNLIQKSNLHGKSNDFNTKESITNPDLPAVVQKSGIGGSAASSFQSAFIKAVSTTKNSPENVDKLVKKIRSDPLEEQKTEPLPADVSDLKLKDLNENESGEWHTVGIFSDLNAKVTDFIPYSDWSMSTHTERIHADNIPNLKNFPRIPLEPGTAYRFRLKAINTFGVGEPGESSSFKTSLPGFPGAPSSIKISKSLEGAHLVWQPPTTNDSNEDLEFTVYLAIKSQRSENELAPGQLAFVRVYSGINSQCLVSNKTLASAHVDYSSKPAVIFRIAAKNKKGYGPATQVRWLQDSHASPQQQQQQSSPQASKATKRK